jgi:predicted nucleic acid-binding Zn ribbon protein
MPPRPLPPKECEVCKASFVPGYRTQKCCSNRCGARLREMNYKRPTKCIECGAKFTGRPGACLCSDECFDKRHARRKRERRRDELIAERGELCPEKKCEFCGERFRPRTVFRWKYSRFCSKTCRNKHRYAVPRVEECDVCGKPIPTKFRADRQTCSKRCAKVRVRERARLHHGTATPANVRRSIETRERAWYRAKKEAEERGEEFNEPRPERESSAYDEDTKVKPEGWESIV